MAVEFNPNVNTQPNFKGEEKKSNGSNPLLPSLLTGGLVGGGTYLGIKDQPTQDTFLQSIKDGTLDASKLSEAQQANVTAIKTELDAIPTLASEGAESVVKEGAEAATEATAKAETVAKSVLESLSEKAKTLVTETFEAVKEDLPKIKNAKKAGLIGAGVALATYIGLKMFGGSDKGEA